MSQRFRDTHRHPSFTQIRHPCVSLPFPILEEDRQIHGMPEVAAPIVAQCPGPSQAPAASRLRLERTIAIVLRDFRTPF